MITANSSLSPIHRCLFLASSTEPEPRKDTPGQEDRFVPTPDESQPDTIQACYHCGGSGSCYVCSGRGRCTNDLPPGSGSNGGGTCRVCRGSGACNQCGGSGNCYYCDGRGLLIMEPPAPEPIKEAA